jgi:hypothetical protein
MHLFLKFSSLLYKTIYQKSQSFEYLSRKFSLVDSKQINSFSTIYPSNIEHFSLLKSDLIVDYRVVTLSKPDYNHLFLAHLIQEGFRHGLHYSTRFINLLFYTVEQSFSENISEHGK